MAGGIDHLVLTAGDLDAQAALYRRLGFTVGARNRHPWGTLNHIVQFDGSFLELISTAPDFVSSAPGSAVTQFTQPVVDRLSAGEGMSQLVLESADAAADQRRFAAAGIAGQETFFFERRGQRPDGSDVQVAFTLAFAGTPDMQECHFFVCQQHYPENFWNPVFQQHANGVTGVSGVVLVAEDVARAGALVASVSGGACRPVDATGIDVPTLRGVIEIRAPAQAAMTFGASALPAGRATAHFAAVRFRTLTPGRVCDLARSARIACATVKDQLVVPASVAHGVALIFEPG